jgi:hypothetical protein
VHDAYRTAKKKKERKESEENIIYHCLNGKRGPDVR